MLAVFVGGVVVGGHAEAVGLTQLKDPIRGWVLGDSGEDLSAQVLHMLRDHYYEPVDKQKLEDASVDALIGKLDDPYTDYLSPAELKALRDRTDRAYYGVGLQVAQRGEGVVVVRVYDGSPAADQGVKAGDRIVSVNGKTAGGTLPRRRRRRDPRGGGYEGHRGLPDRRRGAARADDDAGAHPRAGRGLADRDA